MRGTLCFTAKMMVGVAASYCFGCGQGDGLRNRDVPPAPSFSGLQPAEVIELDRWVSAEAELVGVAVAPDGQRFVLDASAGLYRLDADGAALVLDSEKLDERYGLSDGLELTDVVAYGPDRFLITAENDGFLLDLWAGTMQSYFCYLPPTRPGDVLGEDPAVPVSISQVLSANGVPVEQRTESVAVNAASGEIFAQPQTLRLDAGPVPAGPPGLVIDPIAGSELFTFGAAGGEPSQVQAVDPNFLAGGMVAYRDRLFLGFGSSLFELTPGSSPVSVGVFSPGTVITGMALDDDASLLVLDGAGRRILRFPSLLP